jgi:hypothetical protein
LCLGQLADAKKSRHDALAGLQLGLDQGDPEISADAEDVIVKIVSRVMQAAAANAFFAITQ